MTDSMDIRDISRKTGLTSRALRFYEAKGLVKPLRTASGRRFFGPAELARLHQIVVLKSAGLSLAQIKQLFDGMAIDLSAILSAQLKMLDEQAVRNARAQSLIHYSLARIGQGEPLDTETVCTLIESGDKMMHQEPKEWREVTDRYFTPAEKAEWAHVWAQVDESFDADEYSARWANLGGRIKGALPMATDSDAAQGFVGEWFALLEPFAAASTPEMWNATMTMYDDMDNWPRADTASADPGFDTEVWDFMKRATAVHLARGGNITTLKTIKSKTDKAGHDKGEDK